MYITKEADYAIRILQFLSKCDSMIHAKEMADETMIPQKFQLKILRKLISSNIVKSHKGVNGGYALAKDPSEISLLDVIECIDGPILFNRCCADGYKCQRRINNDNKCVVNAIFLDLGKEVKEKLDSYTFDKL